MSNILDVAGIGIGPFNLSLALMLSEKTNLNFKFFDKKPEFSWHDGMTLPNSKMQVHFLKDLITPTDPTSKFSFLNYLAEEGLIYIFLNRNVSTISREEFTKYLKWVARSLNKNIEFNSEIKEVRFDGENFEIIKNEGRSKARHLVVGTGITPNIPAICKGMMSSNFFHNYEFASKESNLNFKGKSVVIVGGGQSGGEILEFLINKNDAPSKITLISRRASFGSLEDTPFVNEFHHPKYVDLFYNFPLKSKEHLLKEQLLTSDGISKETIFSIYEKLYDLKYIKGSNLEVFFLTNQNLINTVQQKSSYKLYFEDSILGCIREINSDIVILATGYHSHVPDFLSPLTLDNKQLNRNYSLISNDKIFLQNCAKISHGISDPNLSLVSVRNAIILNSIAGKEVYKVNGKFKSLIYDKTI